MVLLFIFEFLTLFFLSRKLTSELSLLFFSIFGSRKMTIFLMASIFLPGTLIHELSHAIMAKALFVYVGKMEIMPKLNGESLKLGSVEVGKTDIVRNFLIGIAPFVVGSILLLAILYFSFIHKLYGFNFFTFLVLYFLFVVSNTMYSSRKDMEGAVKFILLVVLPILILYLLGVRLPQLNWKIIFNKNFYDFLNLAVVLLFIPLLLDILVIIFAKIITKRH